MGGVACASKGGDFNRPHLISLQLDFGPGLAVRSPLNVAASNREGLGSRGHAARTDTENQASRQISKVARLRQSNQYPRCKDSWCCA